MNMLDAAQLAVAVTSGPITPERLRKVLRFLETKADFAALLAAIPDAQRAEVDAVLRPIVRVKIKL
jgi:hypothetical protein